MDGQCRISCYTIPFDCGITSRACIKLSMTIENRIGGIYKSSGRSLLNRNQEGGFGGPREIAVSLIVDSSLLVPIDTSMSAPTYRCCESCHFNSLHLAFILPSLNHEWFDIHRRPITAQDTSWLPLFSTNSTDFLPPLAFLPL